MINRLINEIKKVLRTKITLKITETMSIFCHVLVLPDSIKFVNRNFENVIPFRGKNKTIIP